MHKKARTLTIAVVIAAVAATLSASPAVARASSGATHHQLPQITPTPQSEKSLSRDFTLPRRVTITTGAHPDAATVAEVKTVLKAHDRASAVETRHSRRGAVIDIGTPASPGSALAALAELGQRRPAALPAEGYMLASGIGRDHQPHIVLWGADATGTYYAAQSLRQIVSSHASVAGVLIRDWPGFGFRGGMESFYGPEWSQADRLSQIDFLAEHKMDTFFYGPAGDPRTGAQWSSLYGADELARMQQVVDAAKARHINFIYRISPESPTAPSNGICHSSATDRAKLIARFQQLWDIGIRQFVIAWDDVSGGFTCSQDTQTYGSDAVPSAAAQTSVVNDVQQNFIDTHAGALPLLTVPTEYYGDQTSAYRTRFDDLLSGKVQIYWTGPGVVSPTITVADLAATQKAFPRHQLAVWDNFPVNDGNPNQIDLGPLVGRAAELGKHTLGITFNELQEQEPSQIVLYTEADYAWNPAGYDADRSWAQSLAAFGGKAASALRTFAENNYSSTLNAQESPVLSPLLADFRHAYSDFGNVDRAAQPLTREFDRLRAAPATLRATLGNELFLTEMSPWLNKIGLYGEAGKTAVEMLVAQVHGDDAGAWRDRVALAGTMAKLAAIPQTAATGVIDPFLAFAVAESDGVLGTPIESGIAGVSGTPAAAAGSSLGAAVDAYATTAYVAASTPKQGDALTVALTSARPVDDVVVLQSPTAPALGVLQGKTASGSWVTFGPVRSGYTDVRLRGTTVSALRVAWRGGSTAPTVYEVIPRYSDALPATVTLDRATAIAAAGTELKAQITVRGSVPRTLSATVAATLPNGWSAQPPTQKVAIRSQGRTVSATYGFVVSVPDDAADGTYPLTFTATDGRRTATSTMKVTVITRPTGSYEQVVESDSPVGYWRLGDAAGSDTAADASGSGLTADVIAPVTLGAAGAVAGDDNTAADLTGGYLNVPDAAPLKLTGPFTLEAWIKPTGTVADPGVGILERYDSPAQNGYILRLAAGNHLQAWVLGASGYSLVTGTSVITPGAWHHVMAVFDGSRLTVYVDGQADGTAPATVSPGAGSGDLRIGARGDDAAQRLTGGIDEVAIYNTALSATDAAAHYLVGATK